MAPLPMKLTSRKPNRRKRVALSMTSMIDVVFLLLIFFMTTAAFVDSERALDPNVKAETSSSGQGDDQEPVMIEIVERDGQFVYQLGARTLTDAAELTALLRRMPPTSQGAFVRGSDAAPYGMAAAAIQACKSAAYTAVTYVPRED